jgi:cytoskeletal protein RodZ
MSTGAHTSGAKGFGPYDYALGDELRGERATLGKTLLDVQRDLRIKAAYIAAIEDAKPEVFPNPGFIAGYVRSYARYLGLDPDEVFWRFCQESGFHGAASGTAASPKRGAARKPGLDMPLARHEPRRMPEISLSGIGSVAMLLCLLGGLGYGGWMVLQNIQRVQFAPVEDTPQATAALDTLQPPATDGPQEPVLADLAAPVAATSLADLYRQQELEVPILVPRDGPIAALDPDSAGPLAVVPRRSPVRDPDAPLPVLPAAVAAAAVVENAGADAVAVAVPGKVVVVAERAAWVRVYLANGTVIFERILEKGETYSPPESSEVPLIWAGNSGSVYVRVGDDLRGPLGRGTRAAKDIPLAPTAIAARFPVVTDVPEVVSQALGAAGTQSAPLIVQ